MDAQWLWEIVRPQCNVWATVFAECTREATLDVRNDMGAILGGTAG